MPTDRKPDDLGEFKPLPAKVLRRLIKKGQAEARELDKLIRDQFTLNAEDLTRRLD